MPTKTPTGTGVDRQPSTSWHHHGPSVRPDPELWELPDIRAALAVRDITTLFRLLCRRHGITQRRLAALVGMSQSEISEIIKGRRVRFYDLLARIADGLGIPRTYLGLADPPAQPDEECQHAVHPTPASSATQPQHRRDRSAKTVAGRRRTASKRARRARTRRRHVD